MSIILDALKKKYEAEIEEGKVNIKVMLSNLYSRTFKIPRRTRYTLWKDCRSRR